MQPKSPWSNGSGSFISWPPIKAASLIFVHPNSSASPEFPPILCSARAGKRRTTGTVLETYSTVPNSFAELNFELNAASAAEQDIVCGSSVSVPCCTGSNQKPCPYCKPMQDKYRWGKRPMFLTQLPQGDTPPRLSLLDAEINTDITAELRTEILRKSRRTSFLLTYQGGEVFVEPLVHSGRIHLAGAGYVALAT